MRMTHKNGMQASEITHHTQLREAALDAPAHLANGAHCVSKLLAQVVAQLLARCITDQHIIIQTRNAHVCLGQDHLDKVDGGSKEGPVLIHLLQLTLVTLQHTQHRTWATGWLSS